MTPNISSSMLFQTSFVRLSQVATSIYGLLTATRVRLPIWLDALRVELEYAPLFAVLSAGVMSRAHWLKVPSE